MGVLQLISSRSFITVNKYLAKGIGLEEAILLGELASEADYWTKNNQLEDGYFYSTVENVENNTTLSDYKQRRALTKLKNNGLVDVKIKGLPAKRYIRINEEQVIKLFELESSKDLSSSSQKIKELDLEKPKGNKNKENNNITNKNKNNKDVGSRTKYFPLDETLDGAFKDFLDMRKKIKKPMTDRAIELAISKLEKLSEDTFGTMDNDKAVEIINQSIEHGWQTFYPLKEEKQQKKSGGYDWDNL